MASDNLAIKNKGKGGRPSISIPLTGDPARDALHGYHRDTIFTAKLYYEYLNELRVEHGLQPVEITHKPTLAVLDIRAKLGQRYEVSQKDKKDKLDKKR